MCYFAAAMFAVQAGMMVAQAAQQGSADQAAYSSKIKQENAQIDAIEKSTIFTYAQNGLQQQQIENKASIQEGQARLKDVAATGEASAAAASSGVSGNSVAELMRSYHVATGKDISTIEADKQGQIGQSMAQNKGAYMSATNQLNGIGAGTPGDPSQAIMARYVGAGLGVGKSFLDNTTKVDAPNNTGGLFGSGGFMGMGRQFG